MTARRPLDRLSLGMMLLLCTLWGAQQVAIKLAAGDIAPIMQVTLRCGISAVLVAALMLSQGDLALRKRTRRSGVLAGVLFGAEFLFVAEGLRYTSASHMAVFLYTSPVFTALGVHLLVPAERLHRSQWLGIAVAFGGIVVAFTGTSAGTGLRWATLWGDTLGIMAGAAWGATTVVIRTTALSEAPPTETLLYQLTVGFVLLLAYAAVSNQANHVNFTPVASLSLLYQAVVVAFASYLTWFWLLRRYLASRLSIFTFMTPLFGVCFGVLLLKDPLDVRFATGAVLVLTGIVVVCAPQMLPALTARALARGGRARARRALPR